MGANLMLVIIVPVLFSLVSVCALGKRVFFLPYNVYTMCCERNKS